MNRADGYHLTYGGESISHYPAHDDPADIADAALNSRGPRLTVDLWEDGHRIGASHHDDFTTGPDGRLRPTFT